MSIQWFPGHMTKTRRNIEQDIKLVDVVIELLDARIPIASRNPDIDSLTRGKPRVVVLNKADMADKERTEEWVRYFLKNNIRVCVTDCQSGRGTDKVIGEVRNVLSDKIEANAKRGINKSIRMMIVGVPNVGKSSFINKISKRASTKVGDKPGVTRGKQWIRLGNGFELLDTPGILWPKFEDENVGYKLAFTGAIKDEILDPEELACALIGALRTVGYENNLCERYKLPKPDGTVTSYEILELIGKNRGFLRSGGVIDTERAAKILLDEFRGCKLGCISLERAE